MRTWPHTMQVEPCGNGGGVVAGKEDMGGQMVAGRQAGLFKSPSRRGTVVQIGAQASF